MSNYVPSKSFRPSPQPPHAYTLAFPFPPTSPVLPLIDEKADTGKFIRSILKNRDQVLGKRIYGAVDYYSTARMAKEFEELKPVDGKGAQAIELPAQVFQGIMESTGMPKFAAEEITENMTMLTDCGYYGGASLEESHGILDEPLTTWKDFIAKEKEFAALK